ncbi:MAG TPA: hypothetical protein VGJ60_17905, partial [Chloroflexota bacterium]
MTERSDSPLAASAFDATLKFATALVRDGMSGVTVVLPREPGVLSRARGAADDAGVQVRADEVGSLTITMRFSSSGQLAEGGGPPWRITRGRCGTDRGRPSALSGAGWRVSARRIT